MSAGLRRLARTAAGRASAKAHSRAAERAAAREWPRRPRRSGGLQSARLSAARLMARRVDEQTDDRQPDQTAGNDHEPEKLGDLAASSPAGSSADWTPEQPEQAAKHSHSREPACRSAFRNLGACAWNLWRTHPSDRCNLAHKRARHRVVAPKLQVSGLARAQQPMRRFPSFVAPVSFDSGDPLCRRKIDSTTRTAVDINSDCQFWNDFEPKLRPKQIASDGLGLAAVPKRFIVRCYEARPPVKHEGRDEEQSQSDAKRVGIEP